MGSVRGLAEVVLWAHDLPASLAFYRDLLELPVISPPERVTTAPGTLAVGRLVGPGRLRIAWAGTPESETPLTVHFITHSADAAAAPPVRISRAKVNDIPARR